MTYTTLGWGDLGNGDFPDILQQAQVNYTTPYDCKNAPDPLNLGASYQTFIHDDMMCAFDVGKDGCFGDSGGPLLVEGATPVVVGITSWGIGCARMPGVYARVDYHFDWIAQQVCDLSEDPPSYFGCDETNVGNIRDDPYSTPTPVIVPQPSPTLPQPTLQPPTVISNDAPPTHGYTVTVSIPPEFNMPSPTNAPPTTTTTTSAQPTPLGLASQTQRASDHGNAMDDNDMSFATPTLQCSSWLILLLPTIVLWGVAW
jgi:hypothetical protein